MSALWVQTSMRMSILWDSIRGDDTHSATDDTPPLLSATDDTPLLSATLFKWLIDAVTRLSLYQSMILPCMDVNATMEQQTCQATLVGSKGKIAEGFVRVLPICCWNNFNSLAGQLIWHDRVISMVKNWMGQRSWLVQDELPDHKCCST